MTKNRSIDFFETQFRAQVKSGDFALNPFETLALPYVSGRVLDLGCGLGNLSVEAARRGCTVLALDASPTAVEHVRKTAAATGLPIRAERAELSTYKIAESYETIVAIGLLMFFPRRRALELLEDIKGHIEPGGKAIINVLAEGTTYMGMFEADNYYLFGEEELRGRFSGWNLLEFTKHRFEAPGSTFKAFVTVVARRGHLR